MNNLDVAVTISAKDNTGAAFGKVRGGVESISQQLALAKAQFIGFQASLMSLEKVRALAELADQVQAVNARLKQVTQSTGEFVQAQQLSYRIARESGAGYEAVATLYTRLSQTGKDYGLTQAAIGKTTEATALSLKLSGASAAESASVIRQLAQALGSGVLRGDEFNSIMENGGRLAKALADGLGLPIGELRALAEQGLLTTDVVSQAIQSQSAKLQAEADAMPRTMGQSVSAMQDQFGRVIDQMNQASGVTRLLGSAFDGLANHMQAALTGAGVVAAVAMAGAVGRASAATQAYIAHKYTEITAERGATATRIAHLKVTESYALAELQAAQASVAAASGMARLTVVENLLIPAQQRLAAATLATNAAQSGGSLLAGGLRGALGLLGGPIGIITTLLTLGATAWVLWGNNAKTAAQQAETAIRHADEQALKLGITQQSALETELKLARAERDRLRNTGASLASRKAADDKVLGIRAALDELAVREKNLAAQARTPTALGAELLGKQLDAYVGQYRQKLDPLKAALDELRAKFNEAGVALDSRKFRDAEALVRQSFAKKGATGKAGGALLGADQPAIEAEMTLLKDGLSRAARAYDMALQDRTISLRDYYQAKTTLEQQGIEAEIKRAHDLLAAQQRIAQAGRGEAERLRARGEVARLEADLIVLNNNRADVELNNARRVAEAERSLADELQRVRDALNAMTGQSGDRRAAIEQQFADLKTRLGNDAAGLALVDHLIDVKVADDNLTKLEARWRLAAENMRNAQASVQIQQQTGLLTEAQARAQIVVLAQQQRSEMARLLPAMEQAAAAIGPEAVARVAAWKNELARSRLVVDEVAVTLNGQAQNAFATMFENIATGAKSASAAFTDMARSILASIAKIASQKLAESIFGAMGAGGGGSGGLGGFVSGLLGFAEGGLVNGPGTGTSDSIPARLSAGEFVMKASAVQQFGVGFMHALNGGFNMPASIGSSLAFAGGGLVPASAPAAQGAQGVRIVNVIDPAMAGDYLNSSAGEKVLLNVLSRNGGVIKNILAGA